MCQGKSLNCLRQQYRPKDLILTLRLAARWTTPAAGEEGRQGSKDSLSPLLNLGDAHVRTQSTCSGPHIWIGSPGLSAQRQAAGAGGLA